VEEDSRPKKAGEGKGYAVRGKDTARNIKAKNNKAGEVPKGRQKYVKRYGLRFKKEPLRHTALIGIHPQGV
jgi:hypothetical protein